MKIMKPILYGALLWVLIFFEVSILMFGFNLKGILYYSVHYIFAILLVAIITALYFRKEKSNFRKGIIIGIIFSIVGIILDIIITVPLFVKDYSLMFGDLGLWIGIFLGIITAGITGLIKKK